MEIRKIFSQSFVISLSKSEKPFFLATNCAHGKIENDDDVIDTVLCIVTVR